MTAATASIRPAFVRVSVPPAGLRPRMRSAIVAFSRPESAIPAAPADRFELVATQEVEYAGERRARPSGERVDQFGLGQATGDAEPERSSDLEEARSGQAVKGVPLSNLGHGESYSIGGSEPALLLS